MGISGKKEYTLIINGVEKSVGDFEKLIDVVTRTDGALGKVSGTTTNTARAAGTHSQALSEEEKAAKKLAETQTRLDQVLNGTTKAQIEANQALQKATRATTLQVKESMAAENSIEGMRVQLSQMKDHWKELDVGSEAFQKMSADILELNDRIKEAEMSTGDFRRNVGNYESAFSGLEKLSTGVEGVNKSTMGLAQGLLGANALMGLFGQENEESGQRAQELGKIIALLSIVEQVNTNIVKEGIIQNKLSVVTDGVRAIQIRAKAAAEAASTKGTIAATIAQKAFNLVASANPFVLLALALAAVGTAIYAFVSRTDSAKKAEELHKNAVDALTKSLDDNNAALDRRVSKLRAMGASELTVIKAQIDALEAQNKMLENAHGEYKAGVNSGNTEINEEWDNSVIKTHEGNKVLIANLKAEYNNYFASIQAKIRDSGKTELELRKQKYDEEVKAASGNNEKLKILEQEYNIDVAKIHESTSKNLTDKQQDERKKLVQDLESYFKDEIQLLNEKYIKEDDLLKGNKQAQVHLAKKYVKERQAIEDEAANKTLELERSAEDSSTALIVGEHEKRRVEISSQYDRQIADYKKKLDKEEDLTEQQRVAITDMITNAEKKKAQELDKITEDELAQRADLVLSSVENTLKEAKNKVDGVVKRDTGGLKLIDIDATRKNLSDVNIALGEYIDGLGEYQEGLTASHNATLAGLEEGTLKYEEEMQKYKIAMASATESIGEAQKEQVENTEQSNGLIIEYYRDLFEKIGGYAEMASDVISSITETLNMGLQAQLEGLNEQLDATNEKYEEAKEMSEEHTLKVEELEERLKNASGARAAAIQKELMEELTARDKAQREEEKLAKQKEKLEADIAKKEKQMKRNDLISNIAQGIANTAQSVTKALTLGPILGPIMAVVVGAMGAAQVGIMTNQLAKLEKGGEIKGPSHANGGVPIPGTNYEAEGGEFVINKLSYGANADLVKFINDTPRAVNIFDLMGVLPENTAPVAWSDSSQSKEDRIVEAIEKIEMRPVVSVTDIIDATDEMTVVRDLAGV